MIENVSNAEMSTKLSECAVQGIHKAVGLTAMILDCIPTINNVYYNIYNNILLIAILY